MRTVVYQSFRTENVPEWISACMASVRAWAEKQGFDYRFWDDRFFDLVPDELRPRASAYKCVLSDYARLVAARELLNEGWDRAVWIDADALIFDPENFTIPFTDNYAFCREVWLDRISLGRPQFQLTVNNSVSVFCRGEKLTEFYLDCARRILAGTAPITPVSIGTQWLLGLKQIVDFPVFTSVGIFGPEMARRFLAGDADFLGTYLAYQTSPVHAINLCLSKASGTAANPDTLDAAAVQEVISRLLADAGKSLNRFYSDSYNPTSESYGHPLTPFLSLKTDLKTLIRRPRRSPPRFKS